MSEREIRVGGPPTGTHRTNCRAASCHVDTHIVAWPAVHERRQKNAWCDTFDNIFFRKNFRYSPYVKFNNGGINGINIRLQNSRYRRMDRGRNGKSFKILFSNDDNWNDRNFRRNYRRGLSEVQNKRETRRLKLQGEDTAARVQQLSGQLQRFENQCRFREETCLVEPIGEINCSRSSVRRYGTRRRDQWTIELSQLTKLSLVSKNSPRKNLFQDGNHQRLAFGLCSWTTEQLQKSGSLVNLFMIKQKFLPGNFSKNTTKKNRINSFPPDPGHKWPGFFCTWIKG